MAAAHGVGRKPEVLRLRAGAKDYKRKTEVVDKAAKVISMRAKAQYYGQKTTRLAVRASFPHVVLRFVSACAHQFAEHLQLAWRGRSSWRGAGRRFLEHSRTFSKACMLLARSAAGLGR